MRQSLCQLPPWCHGVQALSLWELFHFVKTQWQFGIMLLIYPYIYDISSACYGESLRHQMLFSHFTSPNFHSRTKDPGKTPTKNRWLSDVCSLCSDGIQVVSLESFVQGMKTRGAWLAVPKRDSPGIVWSDLVGLYWLEFSGASF